MSAATAASSGISSRNENQCAGTGCPNPVTRNPRGRPRLYCTPACQMTAHRYDHPDRHAPLTVETDHGSTSSRSRPAGHVWLVRLRRGNQQAVIAAAEHLAAQIRDVIDPPDLDSPAQTR